MYWSRILAGTATIWLGLLLCSTIHESQADETPTEPTRTPLSIDAIRELADLTVLEINATEVVTSTVSGHTGSTNAVVVVAGSITIAVDLEQAHIVEVDQDRQHLVLTLPPPSVRDVAIDHNASHVASCQRSGLWELAIGEAHEDRVIADAFAIGQRRLEVAGGEQLFTHRARQHTEAVIHRFAREVGWTIEVLWEE